MTFERPWVYGNIGQGVLNPPGGGGSGTGSGGGIPDVVLGTDDTLFPEDADLLEVNYTSGSAMFTDALSMVSGVNGAWIHFLQGTYDWAASCDWPQGIRITGAGTGATTLLARASTNVGSFFSFSTYAGNTNAWDNREQSLQDITLNGNKANTATVANCVLVGATAVSRNLRFDRVQMINATGSGVGGASGNCLFSFNEVEVAYCNSHGMKMQNASHHHNCWYHNNGGDGFQDLAHGGTHYFTNCIISNNSGDGIDVQDLLARARLVVLGSSINNNGGAGIQQGYLATASIIVGNVVVANTGSDISVHPDSIVSLNITDDVPSPDTGGNVVGGTGSAPRVAQTITFSRLGDLATVTGTSKWVAPRAGTIIGVRAAVGTAPTGSAIRVNVLKNDIGNSIFTLSNDQPTIADGSEVGAETVPTGSSTFVAGDYLTVDIDQVGSTVVGADLTVTIEFRFTEVL